jgi:hypothetical protein
MGHESFDRDEIPQGGSNRALGIVFAVVFALIAFVPALFGGRLRLWSFGVSVAFLAAAFLAPALLGPLNRAWTRFGLLLHRIVSPIVLGFMFFVVVTPIGLLMRAFGKDPLRLRFDRAARTYWIERKPPGPAPESLSDQF